MRCLIVTKDIGGFKVVLPVARALKDMDHRVTILAEGLSVALWKEAGWTLAFEGSVNFKEQPFAFDAEIELVRHQPDVVLVTSGSPMNIEAQMSSAAFKRGISQAWIEDVWGVTARLPQDVTPDLVFTLDLAGQKMLREDPRSIGRHIVVAGNLALSNLIVPINLTLHMAELREQHGTLILFCGQSTDTRDMLNILFTSLVGVTEPFVVIPRWHPKRVTDGNNREIWETQVAMFSALKPNSVLRLDDVKTTDALGTLCDITVSGVGTTLLYAAQARKDAISITTPTTRHVLLQQVRYDRWPGLEVGIGLELTEPVPNLLTFVRERRDAMHAAQDEYFKNPPLSARQIAEEILKIAK